MVRHRNRGVWHDTILGEATDGTLGCSVPLAAVLGKCTAQYRGLLDESFTKSEPMLRIMIGPCTKERTGPLHERAKRDGQCYRPAVWDQDPTVLGRLARAFALSWTCRPTGPARVPDGMTRLSCRGTSVSSSPPSCVSGPAAVHKTLDFVPRPRLSVVTSMTSYSRSEECLARNHSCIAGWGRHQYSTPSAQQGSKRATV